MCQFQENYTQFTGFEHFKREFQFSLLLNNVKSVLYIYDNLTSSY